MSEKIPTHQKAAQVRTLLAIWPQIDRRIKHNERLVHLTAQHSFSSDVSAENIVDKIIERIYQKERLQIIKNKIEKLVEMLGEHHKQVIRFYFWDKIPAIEIASKNNVSVRTIFRKLKSGIDELACSLDKAGFNTFIFNSLLENKWIYNIHDSILNGELSEAI
ncbi:MAG: hypothetical protein FWE45_01745 [Firmicutes bacterium]|nr:hypothetical protein [Bacillota bacterium]